jgi:hypothetical protein
MYEKKRPNKKHLRDIIGWLQGNGIHLYTACADLETGEQFGGMMDVETVEEIVTIYEHYKNKTWVSPEYMVKK